MADDLFLDGLTPPQREAVAHDAGPLLVLAGAGSGKTRVITRRAARLASQVGPHRVLAITFTNKAAGEMLDRVAALGWARGMWVCTFHSLGARLLRIHGPAIGLDPRFTIFDQADRLGVVRQAIEDCGLSAEHWRPRAVEAVISRAKNAMMSPDDFEATAFDFNRKTELRIFRRYEDLLHEQNGLDFDDLLLRTANMLESSEVARMDLQERYVHVLIDEYQDTNHAQYLIAQRLTARRRNVCATGDPDQSIYAWRGANINNILEFERDYPEAKIVRLEQNFRSTKRILSAASRVIACNVMRKEKTLWTDNDVGAAVHVWNCLDEHQEAAQIVGDVMALKSSGVSGGDIAVFYRITALTRVLEEAFRKAGVNYQIARGVEFYNRKEIKDVLAYVRMVVNPADATACERAINTPTRGIGKTTVQRLIEHARGRGIALRAAMVEADKIAALKTGKKKVLAFAGLIDELAALPTVPVKPFLEDVIARSGLRDELEADPDPEKPALENVHELISAAAEYDRANPDGSLIEWLAGVSLSGDTDRVDLAGGVVTLMTLHAAKGLEFPHVYIAGLEEGLLPHARALQSHKSAEEVEEERRLFFVGMTRAMRRLTISRAENRLTQGVNRRTVASLFLNELPKDEIKFEDFVEFRRDGQDRSNDEYSQEISEYIWKRGQLVRHPDYGMGHVISLDVIGRMARVRVKFNAHGIKTFALEHADLEVVDS